MPAAEGIQASDDSFIWFAFGCVSVALIVVYIPAIFLHGSQVCVFLYSIAFKGRARQKEEVENPFLSLYESAIYVPKVLFMFVQEPGLLVEGLKFVLSQRGFAFFVCLPKFIKFCFRPKILVLWLWCVLLSTALYTTLTFDAHGILGVPADASSGEIKKAYRQLSRMYHPDLNKTEAAKPIYANIRKAYKALVDKDAFEEEMGQEQLGVGIALPSFLVAKENDTLVLFGLLGLLFAVPFGIWYKFKGDISDKLIRLKDNVLKNELKIAQFLSRFNIPKDPRLVEKRHSKEKIAEAVRAVGLFPVDGDLSHFDGFPPFADFRARCLDASKHKVFLLNLGFDDEGVEKLATYFMDHPEEVEQSTHCETGEFKRLSMSAYKTNRFMLNLLVEEVKNDLNGIEELLHSEFRSHRRIQRHNEEIMDTLRFVYEREKYMQKDVQFLIDGERKCDDLTREFQKELAELLRKRQNQYIQMMQREYKMQMQAARRANRQPHYD